MASDSGALPPTPKDGEVGANLNTQRESVSSEFRGPLEDILCACGTGNIAIILLPAGVVCCYHFSQTASAFLQRVYPLPLPRLLNEASCDEVCFC